MQPYITVYLKSLVSAESRKSAFKNLRAAYIRHKCIAGGVSVSEKEVFSHPWHKMTVLEASSIKSKLIEEGKSASYINTILTFVRKTLHWAFVTEDISMLRFEQVKAALVSVKSNEKARLANNIDSEEVDLDWLMGVVKDNPSLVSEKGIAGLNRDTVAAIIKGFSKTRNKGLRDRAIFMCMSLAGLRRDEVSTLKVGNLNFARGKESLNIVGKGSKPRTIPMSSTLASGLREWLTVLMAAGGLIKDSYLFQRVNKYDQVVSKKLTNSSVYMIIRDVGENHWGLALHPHSLRYYFATQLILNGHDIFKVASLLGHSNIDTTRRYDQRGFDVLQDAVESM